MSHYVDNLKKVKEMLQEAVKILEPYDQEAGETHAPSDAIHTAILEVDHELRRKKAL